MTNIKYDEEKTLALLEVLEKEGDIKSKDVAELPKLFQRSLVEINLKAGKGSFKTTLNEKDLDFVGSTDETKEFIKKYLEERKLMFFPKKKEADIDRISSRNRAYIRRAALKSGINGYYVSLSNFRDIMKKFEESKKEFFDERDDLIENLETYKKIFKDSTLKMLKEKKVDNVEEVLQSLVDKFPTKDQLMKDFYFELTVQPYPVLSTVEDMDPAIASVIEDGASATAIDTFYGIVGSILGNLFDRVAKTMEVYSESNLIPNKTKGGIRTTLENALSDNVIIRTKR